MSITDALQPTLARLRASYAQSPLPDFFAWWGGQLRACLPPRLRALVEERGDILLLESRADALVVYRVGDAAAALTSIDKSLSVEEQRLAFAACRKNFEDTSLRTVLCLPRPQVLLRRLKLPAAAENNLVQVLAFEMDRQTPFKADQVYSDQRIAERDPVSKALTVDLAVVPKATLDAELARLDALELSLDGVDGWSNQPGSAPLGFNFLPVARRVRHRNMRLRLNLALAAAALVLLVVAMNLWVSNREQAVALMTTDVTALQNEAKQVATLRKGLADSLEAASFLSRKKVGAPSMVAMLLELTHAIPDDTWLQRLSVSDSKQVNLQGQSEHAASLIEKLAGAKTITGPSFQGVIQPDARTGKERFNIVATLAVADASVADASAADASVADASKEKADASSAASK